MSLYFSISPIVALYRSLYLQKEVVDTKTYVQNSPEYKLVVQNSPEYKLVAIILDVAKFRLYKPIQTVSPRETPTRDFLKLEVRNKGLDAVNISNILNHKKVTSTIPTYFKTRAHLSSPTVIRLLLHLTFSITKTCCKG